jgi:hypothetical protein
MSALRQGSVAVIFEEKLMLLGRLRTSRSYLLAKLIIKSGGVLRARRGVVSTLGHKRRKGA